MKKTRNSKKLVAVAMLVFATLTLASYSSDAPSGGDSSTTTSSGGDTSTAAPSTDDASTTAPDNTFVNVSEYYYTNENGLENFYHFNEDGTYYNVFLAVDLRTQALGN